MAVTGALLHDIGKIEAYDWRAGAIDLSDAGRLQGEIPLGYYIVRREIERMPGFPAEAAQAVLHIVLPTTACSSTAARSPRALARPRWCT